MSRHAWVLFAAMSLIWGMPYLLIKIVVAEVDPTFMVFARLAMSAVVLLPIAAARGALVTVGRHWPRLVATAVVGICVPFVLIGYGEQHITSSLAALLIAADPLFIALLALRFDPTERATRQRLLGLVIGLVGVAAVVGLNVGGDAQGLLGGAMVLVAALCYAANSLWVKAMPDVAPIAATAVALSLAGVVLAPLALLRVPAQAPSGTVLVSLVTLGLLCTALAYVLYFSLIQQAGPTRAALITYVNPAVAVALGVVILGEPLTTGTVVGFGLIVVGCALATDVVRAARRRAPASS